jgi:hypothetical protein
MIDSDRLTPRPGGGADPPVKPSQPPSAWSVDEPGDASARAVPETFENMGGSGVAVARQPDVRLLLGDLLHQSRLRDIGHCCEILNWTHRNVWEGEAIRRHAVDQ